jgi:hypothetical protein
MNDYIPYVAHYSLQILSAIVSYFFITIQFMPQWNIFTITHQMDDQWDFFLTVIFLNDGAHVNPKHLFKRAHTVRIEIDQDNGMSFFVHISLYFEHRAKYKSVIVNE